MAEGFHILIWSLLYSARYGDGPIIQWREGVCLMATLDMAVSGDVTTGVHGNHTLFTYHNTSRIRGTITYILPGSE